MLSGCRDALLFARCLPRLLLCPPWFLLDMISSCVVRLLIVCMSSHGDFLLCLLRPCPLCISPRSIALAILFLPCRCVPLFHSCEDLEAPWAAWLRVPAAGPALGFFSFFTCRFTADRP